MLFPNSGGYSYDSLVESDQGVFVVGTRDNSIQRIQYSFQLNTVLSKTPQDGQFKYEK